MRNQNDLPEEPFDPDSDPLIENDELNFTQDEELSFSTLSPEFDTEEIEILLAEDASAQIPSDDLNPEDLIKEDGARSAYEPSANLPADEDLRVVGVAEIGAGYGLDEAELAHTKPLDGNPGS
jgi:hypothetical protein